MKTPIEFLLEKIEYIISKFPEAKIKYEYNRYIHSHNIKILPFELYNNENYYKLEDLINDEFVKLYPGELVVFKSSDSKYVFEDIILFDNTLTLKEKIASSTAGQYSYFDFNKDLYFISSHNKKQEAIFFKGANNYKDFFPKCESLAGNEEFALAA